MDGNPVPADIPGFVVQDAVPDSPIPKSSASKRPAKPRSRKVRPSKSEPMLAVSTVIQGKFVVTNLIGAGGYGQILKAKWKTRQSHVAIKIMTRAHEPQRMILEQAILRKLKGKRYFPELYASGNHEAYMYIVMELLGRSLSELRKKQFQKRFDAQTAIRVGLQTVNALAILHDAGYVHRDMKPGNLCTGYTASTIRNIYIVDFGLARRFKGVKVRPKVGFRGTMRYASIRAQERKEQTPFDDLVSLFYSIIELSEGTLPWTKTKDATVVIRQKKSATAEQLCVRQPINLYEFYMFCTSNEYQPYVYEFLKEVLMRALPPNFDLDGSAMSYELPAQCPSPPPEPPKSPASAHSNALRTAQSGQ